MIDIFLGNLFDVILICSCCLFGVVVLRLRLNCWDVLGLILIVVVLSLGIVNRWVLINEC